MKKKIVYMSFSVDILHEGHINILKKASQYGDVVVGLLTDAAIGSYKSLPHFNYDKRKNIIESVKYVSKIVSQDTLDYTKNLKMYKPDYVVHGDDWKNGFQKSIRAKVIKTLKPWNGKLIEPKYTSNISSEKIKKVIFATGTTPEIRKAKMKRLIMSKKIVRILETHSPLAGLILEKLSYRSKNEISEFDGMWSSSLTDSILRGKPDNGSVDYSTRINWINQIFEVTTKPMIFDGDNGGRIEHIRYTINYLERIGVSAIIIEDKIGVKKNSLFKNQKGAKQDSIKDFSKKIIEACKAKVSEDFMVIARIESFILGKNLADAIKRAEAYSKAGADAVLIHSKENTPKQIFSFAKRFTKSKFYKPMVAVPTSYSKTNEAQLIKAGFKVVIYANQMQRAAYPAMHNVAETILRNKRSYELENKISSVNEIINLIK